MAGPGWALDAEPAPLSRTRRILRGPSSGVSWQVETHGGPLRSRAFTSGSVCEDRHVGGVLSKGCTLGPRWAERAGPRGRRRGHVDAGGVGSGDRSADPTVGSLPLVDRQRPATTGSAGSMSPSPGASDMAGLTWGRWPTRCGGNWRVRGLWRQAAWVHVPPYVSRPRFPRL